MVSRGKWMMNKVSIIVPTYNVEAYIQKCLDSLVNQSSKDFVAYIINDGSPANEIAIVEPYAIKYPFIKSITKPNGGYGSVLNKALEIVETPYFLICDPDDYLREDAVESLIKLMEMKEVDLVIGAKQLVYSDNEEMRYDSSFNASFAQLKNNTVYESDDEAFEQLFFVEPSPHAKLYKTEMVKKIKFPEKVSYTDNLLYYMCLLQSKKVVYTSEAYAYYLINREGNTRTDLRPTIIDHWVKVISEILKQSETLDGVPSIFYYRMFESFKFVFNKVDFIKANEEELFERLVSTRKILDLLIPHRQAILSQFKRSQSSGRERQNDLLLLDEKKYQKTFDKLVKKKLYRLKHGGGIKARVKSFIVNEEHLNIVYKQYHHYAKYIYARKNPKLVLHPQLKLRTIDDNGQTFFGYFNRSAERNGKYLYHRIQSNRLSLHQTIEICVDQRVIGTSTSWNWQQGAMANWLDDQRIIFNTFVEGRYVSNIVDLDTMNVRQIDDPVYSVSASGKFALSLNFSRLAKYRPDYGYINVPFDHVPDFDVNDGIYWVDLISNTSTLIINFKQLYDLAPNPSMINASHKVNHIDISPKDDKCIFLHRWINKGKKYTRLIQYTFTTKDLEVISDYEMVSHCFWEDNETIIAYLKGPDLKDGYFRIQNGVFQPILPALRDDGHPSTKTNYLVTDTYPDHRCYQTLWFAKSPYKDVTQLAMFYSGIRYEGQQRCDLHPRWNTTNTNLTVDTVYQGKRQLVELDLSQFLEV
jgi:glycosyltransferase involved in cell wall biosynthesis